MHLLRESLCTKVLDVQVRLDMAHHLILAYELHKDMDVYVRLCHTPS